MFSLLRDYMFYNAARQSSFSLVVMFITTLFLLFFSLIISSTIKAITEMQKQIDYEELENLCESLDDEKIDEGAKKAIVLDARTKVDKYKKKYTTKPESKPKKQKRSLYIYLFFVIIIVLYFVLYVFTPAFLWDLFERTITMVSPYMDEAEVKLLRSKWVSMKSFDDFNGINTRLLQIREEHNMIS